MLQGRFVRETQYCLLSQFYWCFTGTNGTRGGDELSTVSRLGGYTLMVKTVSAFIIMPLIHIFFSLVKCLVNIFMGVDYGALHITFGL